jgi:hypothetical protein
VDAFSYLSVLISIILGLAITEILQGLRGLVIARARVRMYWPSVAWAVLTILVSVQSWWAMFGMRQLESWTFVQFAVVLIQVIATYMLAALVLPDFEGDHTIDLRTHYFRQIRWFSATRCASCSRASRRTWSCRDICPVRSMSPFISSSWRSGSVRR